MIPDCQLDCGLEVNELDQPLLLGLGLIETIRYELAVQRGSCGVIETTLTKLKVDRLRGVVEVARVELSRASEKRTHVVIAAGVVKEELDVPECDARLRAGLIKRVIDRCQDGSHGSLGSVRVGYEPS